MKVLLDECLDWRLSREIVGHEVRTVRQAGWAGVKNGELLALAVDAFDVFVTADRKIAFQQNLNALPIPIIVLHAKSNRLVDLRRLVPRLLAVLKDVQSGVVTVS